MVPKSYVSFQSERFRIPYSFLYPAGWKVKEITEEGYTEVYIAGSHSQAGTLTVSFRVILSSESEQTLEEAINSFLRKYSSVFSIQVRGQASGKVAEFPAVEVEVAFSMPLPPDSVSPQMTVICERRVFLKREDNLFEFLYRAPEEDYRIWLEAFRILLQTFTFLEETPGTAFHPLVTGATHNTIKSSSETETRERAE